MQRIFWSYSLQEGPLFSQTSSPFIADMPYARHQLGSNNSRPFPWASPCMLHLISCKSLSHLRHVDRNNTFPKPVCVISYPLYLKAVKNCGGSPSTQRPEPEQSIERAIIWQQAPLQQLPVGYLNGFITLN